MLESPKRKCAESPGSFLLSKSRVSGSDLLGRADACPVSQQPGTPWTTLGDCTDLGPSAGTLATYTLSLDGDSEDMGPSFRCDLRGLPLVKGPVFSSLVIPGLAACQAR